MLGIGRGPNATRHVAFPPCRICQKNVRTPKHNVFNPIGGHPNCPGETEHLKLGDQLSDINCPWWGGQWEFNNRRHRQVSIMGDKSDDDKLPRMGRSLSHVADGIMRIVNKPEFPVQWRGPEAQLREFTHLYSDFPADYSGAALRCLALKGDQLSRKWGM